MCRARMIVLPTVSKTQSRQNIIDWGLKACRQSPHFPPSWCQHKSLIQLTSETNGAVTHPMKCPNITQNSRAYIYEIQ